MRGTVITLEKERKNLQVIMSSFSSNFQLWISLFPIVFRSEHKVSLSSSYYFTSILQLAMCFQAIRTYSWLSLLWFGTFLNNVRHRSVGRQLWVSIFSLALLKYIVSWSVWSQFSSRILKPSSYWFVNLDYECDQVVGINRFWLCFWLLFESRTSVF